MIFEDFFCCLEFSLFLVLFRACREVVRNFSKEGGGLQNFLSYISKSLNKFLQTSRAQSRFGKFQSRQGVRILSDHFLAPSLHGRTQRWIRILKYTINETHLKKVGSIFLKKEFPKKNSRPPLRTPMLPWINLEMSNPNSVYRSK